MDTAGAAIKSDLVNSRGSNEVKTTAVMFEHSFDISLALGSNLRDGVKKKVGKFQPIWVGGLGPEPWHIDMKKKT